MISLYDKYYEYKTMVPIVTSSYDECAITRILVESTKVTSTYGDLTRVSLSKTCCRYSQVPHVQECCMIFNRGPMYTL